jgi:uncharacterized protein
MNFPRVLTLPGWQSSGPSHWQSLWEQRFGYLRVEQHDWDRPLRGDWITRLEDAILSMPLQDTEHQSTISSGLAGNTAENQASRDVVLVAHSLGCHLVAAWAAVSPSAGRVRGALLVAPPDTTRADWPAELHSWRNSVRTALPFPASCVLSSNDPFSSLSAGRDLAMGWGARSVEVGDAGHINGASGLGDWPAGHALLKDISYYKDS